MAQFTVYSSYDVAAPILNGLTGSLLTVLDACLVTGYGTKPGAGWTKPLVNSASCGCYRVPTGSMSTMFINDSGPGGQDGAEARIRGFYAVTSMDNGKATGSYGFPPESHMISGHAAIRKSSFINANMEEWIIFADSRSMYCYTKSANAGRPTTHYVFSFGDYYSYFDILPYNPVLTARFQEASTPNDYDTLSYRSEIGGTTNGSYIMRNPETNVTSVQNGFVVNRNIQIYYPIPYPSPAGGLSMDNVYLYSSNVLVGHMRGYHQIYNSGQSLLDGLVFSGSGGYSGKIFQLVGRGYANNITYHCMEISDTLDTN